MAIDNREMIGAMDQPSIRHRNTLKQHYTMTSNVLLFGYKSLSDSEKLTYQAIDSYDWSDGDGKRKGYAYPSAETLAALRGVDRRTIFRHFDALERAALLTREQRTGRPTLLWIEEPSKEESERYLSTIALGRDTDVTPTRDTDVTPLDESEEEKQTKPLTRAKAFKGRRGGKRFLSAEERAKRDWLANHMAKQLKDSVNLNNYRKIASTVSEHRIFQFIAETREANSRKEYIRNPGALFTSKIVRHQETRRLKKGGEDAIQ